MTGIDELFTPSGAPSFTKNQTVGETRTAMITDTPFVQQVRDYQSGDPQTWPDGNPKNQLVIPVTTDTGIEGADDDGRRSIYVKGWGKQQRALFDAVKQAGKSSPSEALTVGTNITVTYVKDAPTKTGFNEKIWSYSLNIAETEPDPQATEPAPQAPGAAGSAGAMTLDQQIAAGHSDEQILAANPAITADVLTYLRSQAK